MNYALTLSLVLIYFQAVDRTAKLESIHQKQKIDNTTNWKEKMLLFQIIGLVWVHCNYKQHNQCKVATVHTSSKKRKKIFTINRH